MEKTANSGDVVIHSYSENAGEYDQERNLDSCWGRLAKRGIGEIVLKDDVRVVVDVGCGAGQALRDLAARTGEHVGFIGVEPAKSMREHAAANLTGFKNITILDGRFENLPLETGTVDYLYSILAFHWVTDLERSAAELARVLKPEGEMVLHLVGKDTGRGFVAKTTPIFIRNLGLAWLLKSARMRQHLGQPEALELFSTAFPDKLVDVGSIYETHYDDLEGHWSWWVSRLSAHFADISEQQRRQCDAEAREAIASLATSDGIPFDVHLLRVAIRPSPEKRA